MTSVREMWAGPGTPSGLLERDVERAMLLRHVDSMLEQRAGTAVFLGGEAGVGKTALLSDVAARCHPRVRLLRADCEPLLAPRPLGPFVDVAAEIDGELLELVTGRGTPHDVTIGLLRWIRESGPTLLLIEDVHWADEGTLDVLRLLAPRLRDVPAVLLASYRDDELGPWHPTRRLIGELGARRVIRRVRLSALSASAVAEMAAPFDADPEEIFRRSGGNPFFVSELLEQGGELPDTVADAVLARVGRLGPVTRESVESVAVIGSAAEPWAIERMMPGSGGAIDDAVAHGLLHSANGTFAFRHELARDAVISAIPAHRKAALHRAALEALRSPPWGTPNVARLAHHAIGAGDPGDILEIVPRAAKEASARGAHREAAVLYEHAAAFADGAPVEDQAALFRGMSLEFFNLTDFESAEAAQRRALACYEQIGDELRHGAAQTALAQLTWQVGSLPEALGIAQASVAELERLPSGPALVGAYCQLAQLLLAAEDPAAARGWAGRATALASAIDRVGTTVLAMMTQGWAELFAGEREGLAMLEQSIALAKEADLWSAAVGAEVVIARTAGRMRMWDVAAEHTRAGLEMCDGRDFDIWRYYLIGWQAKVALATGEWDAASAHAGISLMNNCPFSRIHALVVLGLVRARRGDPDAWVPLDEARALALPRQELQWIGPAAAARAEAACLEGREDAIASELEPALALPLRPGDPYAASLAYWADRGGVDVHLDAGPRPDPYLLQIDGEWERAADRWRELGCPYEAAVALGECEDLSAVQRAHEQLRELGARPMAATFARRLRDRGVRGIRRGPRNITRENPSGLTGRELEVLALLADGRRNAEIAVHLVVSPKTVDHHVSAILRKLMVSSRTEAAAEAARLGLVGR